MGLLNALGLPSNPKLFEQLVAEDGGLMKKDVCAPGHHKPTPTRPLIPASKPRPLIPETKPQPMEAPIVAGPTFGPDTPLLPDSMIRVAGVSVADIDARIAEEMLDAAEVRAAVRQYIEAYRSAEAEISPSTKRMSALLGTPFEALRAEIQAASRGSTYEKAAHAQQAKGQHNTNVVLLRAVRLSSRAAENQLSSLQTQLQAQKMLDRAAALRDRAKEIEDDCAKLAFYLEVTTTVVAGDPKDKVDLVGSLIIALIGKLQGVDGFIAEAESLERDAKEQRLDQLAEDISETRTLSGDLLETLRSAKNVAGAAADAYAQRRQEALRSFDKKSKGHFRFADLELALSIASKPIIPLQQCERRLRDAVAHCERLQEWASQLGKSIAKECSTGHHKRSDGRSKPSWIAEHVASEFAAKAVEAKRVAHDRMTELGRLSADLHTKIAAVQVRKSQWLAFFDAAEEALYKAEDVEQ